MQNCFDQLSSRVEICRDQIFQAQQTHRDRDEWQMCRTVRAFPCGWFHLLQQQKKLLKKTMKVKNFSYHKQHLQSFPSPLKRQVDKVLATLWWFASSISVNVIAFEVVSTPANMNVSISSITSCVRVFIKKKTAISCHINKDLMKRMKHLSCVLILSSTSLL
jgi:hypothetical protein